MKIRHERPMSDLSFQVRAPLVLELPGGERMTIYTWSLGGILCPDPCDVLPTAGTLSIPFQGVDIRFPVRLTPGAEAGELRFEGLTGRQRETLAVFYRSILSGKMASTEEVITSLDTPVDLVPMGETEEEKAAGTKGKTPRSLRATMAVAIYVLLAAVVFYTLGSGIWGALSTVNVRNARVEAAIVPHTAPDAGFVDAIRVAPGDVVAAGDVLVDLTNPEVSAALDEVRGRIDLLDRRLAEAVAQEAALARRIAEARIRLTIARDVADATGDAAGFTAAVQALDAFDSRYSDDHRPLFEAHAAVRREIDALEDELRRLRRERGGLRDADLALDVVAAAAGTVTEVPILEDQYVGRGALTVVLEEAAPRIARGWVDQSMAAALHTGMEVRAEVNLGAGRQTLRAEILSLEAGIDPTLSDEFGMIVSVGFPALDLAQTRALPDRLPVTLRAQRGWARDWAPRRLLARLLAQLRGEA